MGPANSLRSGGGRSSRGCSTICRLPARMWLSLNYSHLHSPNIARLGTPAAVFATSNWVDGNLLFDATRSVRFGVAYGFSEQTYGDGVKAHNHRVQGSGFFLF